MLGRPDQALATQLGALAHAEHLRHLHTIAQALTYLCFVRLLRREPEGVRDAANRLVKISDEQSFPLMIATGRFWLGWSVAEQGNLSLGMAQMEQAAGEWWATGAQTYRSFAETLMAAARLRAGDIEGADQLLQAASERVAASDERWAEAELLRVRGEHARARGDVRTAHVLFRSAFDCAVRQRAPMWTVRAATSLGRSLIAEGRASDARDLLAGVLAGISEGATTRDLEEARRVFEVAGASARV